MDLDDLPVLVEPLLAGESPEPPSAGLLAQLVVECLPGAVGVDRSLSVVDVTVGVGGLVVAPDPMIGGLAAVATPGVLDASGRRPTWTPTVVTGPDGVTTVTDDASEAPWLTPPIGGLVVEFTTSAPQVFAFNPLTQVSALHSVWAEDPEWDHPPPGEPVDEWRNGGTAGGGDPSATGAARPIYRPAGITGRAGVEFDGDDDFLVAGMATRAQPFKVLVVVDDHVLTPGVRRILGRGVNANHGVGATNNGSYVLHYNGMLVSPAGPSSPGVRVIRWTVDGDSSSMWIDGEWVATGATGGANQQSFCLGSGHDGSSPVNHWGGLLGFLGLYSGDTPDEDLEALEQDLLAYYSIDVPA